ncbi:MAG: PQQ-binding-like beta-propeller repeat protein [Candidatus Bathyarchaeota archaeon]|nr:PQQ-binding-like beta-propeller repeat protein [Candidatus Bathyarchaeota archaeon]
MKQRRMMKISIALLAILIISAVGISFAQTSGTIHLDDASNVSSTNVIWAKTYGGPADDRAFYALPVQDGSLVVGSSMSVMANSTVGWILRLNGEGNVLWNQTFLNGDGTEVRCAINLTNGFLLVGNQFLSGDVNGYVARIDDEGNLLWEKTLGGKKIDKLFSGVAGENGFALFGLTYSYGGSGSAAWIVQLDFDGDVVWNKTFGQSTDSSLRAGVLAHDGGYVATGYIDTEGSGDYDFYLLKVNSDGDEVWNKTYGGVDSEKGYSMAKVFDGYVVVGEKQCLITSSDAWLIKVDVDGNLLWDKTISGADADSPAYITPARDGNYLVAGFTFSFGEGQRDFWLFKITDDGQLIFSCTHGNAAFQEAYCVIEADDNKYIMVGWANPENQPELVGKATYDFYIVCLSVTQSSDALALSPHVYVGAVFLLLVAAIVIGFNLRQKGN